MVQRVMSAEALLELMGVWARAGIEVWLDGGWGVDALLGQEHRLHHDVDVIPRVSDVLRLCAVLATRGFVVKEGAPPHAFVLHDGQGLEVDVHAVVFDVSGNGVYRMENGEDWIYPSAGFAGRGSIAGVECPCLTPQVQVLCHAEGYVPTEKDKRDMALLQERFGVALPAHLRFDQID